MPHMKLIAGMSGALSDRGTNLHWIFHLPRVDYSQTQGVFDRNLQKIYHANYHA